MAAIERRIFVACTAAALARPALAQGWPTRPVTVVVPYAPGGSADATARLVAERMGQRLGQTLIVDNRPGGPTTVGAERVIRSPADGYTLMVTAGSTLTTNPHQFRNLPYQVSDFAPVGLITRVPFAIVVRRGLPWDLQSFVAYARANPGKLQYGTTGRGAFNHLAGVAAGEALGIDWSDVPYRGGGPATTDVLGGRLDVNFDAGASAVGAHQSGQAAIVAWTGERRMAGMPDVPTLSEIHPGLVLETYFCLLAPARTPPAILERLNAVLVETLNQPTVRERLEATGQIVAPTSIAAFITFLDGESERYGSIIRRRNLQLD